LWNPWLPLVEPKGSGTPVDKHCRISSGAKDGKEKSQLNSDVKT